MRESQLLVMLLFARTAQPRAPESVSEAAPIAFRLYHGVFSASQWMTCEPCLEAVAGLGPV